VPSLAWDLEQHPLGQLIFDSPLVPLKGMGHPPFTVPEVVQFLERQAHHEDEKPHPAGDPLIGRAKDSSVLIHDGNGRLLSCAYAIRDGKRTFDSEVAVWVGRSRVPTEHDRATLEFVQSTLFLTHGRALE
jgi:hypothetical protein